MHDHASQVVNEFDITDHKISKLETKNLPIGAEGWGLASHGDKLYLTDSTDVVFHLDHNYSKLAKMKIIDDRLQGADGKSTPFTIAGGSTRHSLSNLLTRRVRSGRLALRVLTRAWPHDALRCQRARDGG